MKRRSRVPGTHSTVWRREIACGADPTAALVRAISEFRVMRRGQVWQIGVSHDNGCPSLERGGMPACTCEIVELRARRAA